MPLRDIDLIPKNEYHGALAIEFAAARKVVSFNGDFTTVTFISKTGGVVHGSAKRNPVDTYSFAVGEELATLRAWRMLRRHGWQHHGVGVSIAACSRGACARVQASTGHWVQEG